jgi:hypothetical protein
MLLLIFFCDHFLPLATYQRKARELGVGQTIAPLQAHACVFLNGQRGCEDRRNFFLLQADRAQVRETRIADEARCV